jgi:ATP-binding cassette subfamily B protein
VRDADLILVMDKGRIVERGTFTRLSKGGGLFQKLVKAGELGKARRPEPARQRQRA